MFRLARRSLDWDTRRHRGTSHVRAWFLFGAPRREQPARRRPGGFSRVFGLHSTVGRSQSSSTCATATAVDLSGQQRGARSLTRRDAPVDHARCISDAALASGDADARLISAACFCLGSGHGWSICDCVVVSRESGERGGVRYSVYSRSFGSVGGGVRLLHFLRQQGAFDLPLFSRAGDHLRCEACEP